MAKFDCKCGNLLSNSEAPNDIEYHVYSDVEWNEIISKDFIESISIPRPNFDVWKCPNCDRLHIFEDNVWQKTYCIESAKL